MSEQNPNENEEPIVNDKRRIDPETGKVREPSQDAQPESSASESPTSDSAESESATPESTSVDDERETISEEDLQALLQEAMAASNATDLPAEDDASAGESGDAKAAAEHLEDLRRVQAEYANYRRRSERQLDELGDTKAADIVKQFLPVLDDLGRAEAAGDLPEGSAVQVIAVKLYGVIERLGVESYGEKGEPFDPTIHEAVAQVPNPEVTGPVIADVAQLGYRIGEREIRPAKVAVFVPAE